MNNNFPMHAPELHAQNTAGVVSLMISAVSTSYAFFGATLVVVQWFAALCGATAGIISVIIGIKNLRRKT